MVPCSTNYGTNYGWLFMTSTIFLTVQTMQVVAVVGFLLHLVTMLLIVQAME